MARLKSWFKNPFSQITNSGFTFDNNGNMTSDGVNTHVWDRANRLLSVGGHSYAYDGDGRRVAQTVSSIVTEYLLDTQPGLAQVIAATTSGNTERYVHGLRGIHTMEDSAGAWSHPTQDGLGSVRVEMDDLLEVIASGDYQPFGVHEDVQGWINIIT